MLRKKQILLYLAILGILLFSIKIVEAKLSEDLISSVTILLVCGDGSTELPEICDPGSDDYTPDLNGLTCTDFTDINGDPFLSGDLGCESDCSAYATSSCYSCGNNIMEPPLEECDGSDFGGRTCISMGFDSGNLVCNNACRLSLVNCVASPGQGTVGGGPGGGSSGLPTGFYPGSNLPPDETKVVVTGKSYPRSDVHILIDGVVTGIVSTDEKANFYFESSEVPIGVVGFGFWSEDPTGLKSTLLSLTFRVTSGAVTNISGIYLSPTIELSSQSVKQGEEITMYGKTVPDSQVQVYIHSEEEFVEKIDSSAGGDWALAFNTNPLEEDFHTAKALFQSEVSGNVIQSGFSRTVSFYVGKVGGEAACAEADLNKDGRVNITDFSILLFYWGTDNACADQNQNGNVDLIDFSIMMYYWTG